MSTSNLHVIVGLGATGLSCVQYLKNRGIPVAVTDTRVHPPQLDALQKAHPDIVIAMGGLDLGLLEKASKIILSPGVALYEPAIAAQVKRGIPVVGDIELFAEVINVPVIGITGTNAKSTVTALVGEMAKAAGYQVEVGGNFGVPVLDLLAKRPSTNLYVLELSSFQLETTYSLKPAVATVLNISPDHMDRYVDLAAYTAAKHRIYAHCQKAVCNRDDAATVCRVKDKLYFTLNTPKKREFGLLKVKGLTYLAYEDEPLLPISELPVSGQHYQANALASLAIGAAFGLPFEPMLKVLREFKGLPHRCQFVREHDGIKWYNDSKGTNVGATEAAIQGLGAEIAGKLVLIAGGVGKNADFTPLVPLIEKYSRHVVLIGEAAEDFATIIGQRVPVSFAKTMDEAVKQAAKVAQPKDLVLLSPACASLDMFTNYEHRGQVFMALVEKM